MYEVKSPVQQPASLHNPTMATVHQATVHRIVTSTHPAQHKDNAMTTQCLRDNVNQEDLSRLQNEEVTVDLCQNGRHSSDIKNSEADTEGRRQNTDDSDNDSRSTSPENHLQSKTTNETLDITGQKIVFGHKNSPVQPVNGQQENVDEDKDQEDEEDEETVDVETDASEQEQRKSSSQPANSHMIDSQKSSEGGAYNPELTGDGTKATSCLMESDSGCAKSIPVHCVVEQVTGPDQEPQVDVDTFAILPSSTLFCEIVRATLVKIGYSPTEALGAKGAIQIKNWRPLTFDTITDDPDATLEDILGELSSIATLRIRICSPLQQVAMEEVKDKLLQFLLLHSQPILTSSGCPLEKNLLLQISKGDCPNSLPEDTQQAFSTWFKEKVQTGLSISNNNNNDITKVPESSSTNTTTTTTTTGENQSHPVSSSPDQPQQLSPNLPQGTGVPQYNGHGAFVPTKYPLNFSSPPHQPPRPRARTSFDPEHEVPRLQKWFEANQHPSRDQMCLYMNELNNQPSRQGRRPLDLTNIIYWFKNARAASRRAMLANKGMDLSGFMDSSFGDSSVGDENEDVVDCYDDADSNTSGGADQQCKAERDVPDLPNKNAVYVVNPMLHPHQSPKKTSPARVETLKVPEYEKEDPKPRDFSIPKLISRDRHIDHRVPSQPNLLFNGNKENHMMSNIDDQPADLSLPKKRKLSSVDHDDDDADLEEISHTRAKASKLMIKTETEMEEGYGSSNTSSPSPSPKSLNSSSSSLSSSHLAGFPNMTHQALQMAAMSHALNMHYMHPAAAAMYPSPLIPPTPPSFHHHHISRASSNTSPRPSPSPQASQQPGGGCGSATSPGGLMSESERKKRSRVFIDPLTEIPKLEKWFIEDTHPSSYMIEKYTEELNMSPYRLRFPKLEPKNVQLWFKNHRAKVKRARQEQAALSQINHANPQMTS